MSTQTFNESGHAFRQKFGSNLNCSQKANAEYSQIYFHINKTTKSWEYTSRDWQRRKQWSGWLTTGEIPTALTKLHLPMVLALLAVLCFLLISLFGGRWCSFAQMGFSLERLTRPRNTIVTNFFIIALMLLQALELIVMPSWEDLWNRHRCMRWKSAAEMTWEEKTLAVCVVQGGRGKRELEWNKQLQTVEKERESGTPRVEGGAGCRQVLLLESPSSSLLCQ